ncbi:MAG: hypothetical protein KF729_26710 [Sandaracinaceae bacterium]|nr:hypothetical protein [Sandaracinaceae bacterium]
MSTTRVIWARGSFSILGGWRFLLGGAAFALATPFWAGFAWLASRELSRDAPLATVLQELLAVFVPLLIVVGLPTLVAILLAVGDWRIEVGSTTSTRLGIGPLRFWIASRLGPPVALSIYEASGSYDRLPSMVRRVAWLEATFRSGYRMPLVFAGDVARLTPVVRALLEWSPGLPVSGPCAVSIEEVVVPFRPQLLATERIEPPPGELGWPASGLRFEEDAVGSRVAFPPLPSGPVALRLLVSGGGMLMWSVPTLVLGNWPLRLCSALIACAALAVLVRGGVRRSTRVTVEVVGRPARGLRIVHRSILGERVRDVALDDVVEIVVAQRRRSFAERGLPVRAVLVFTRDRRIVSCLEGYPLGVQLPLCAFLRRALGR